MMASDERTYIKVHDGIEDHPKTALLSDKAFRLLITTWGWCSRHLTDGRVPMVIWRQRGTKRVRDELIVGRLVEVYDDHVIMHDYPQHQRSAAEVQERRDARQRGARLANHRRWHIGRGIVDDSCEFCASESDTESLERSHSDQSTDNGAISLSDQSTENQETRSTENQEITVGILRGRGRGTEREKKKTSSTAARSTGDDPDFVKFWEVYPRKVGKGEARKAWAKVIKSGVDPVHVIAGAERYRDDPLRRRKDVEYTKHPGPWLNAERWIDQLNGNDIPPSSNWWDN